MRTFQFYFCVLCMTILMVSCKKETKKEEETSQMESVIAIHDELMPKMSTIGSLITQLNSNSDSLSSQEAISALKDSHDAMMTWMQDFGDDFDTDEVMHGKALSEEKHKLLDIQEQKVNALKDQMNISIENAKAIIAKTKNQ